jgi:hemerythrin-like metal-binding protein
MSKHQATSPLPPPLPQAGEGENESLCEKKFIFDESRHALNVVQMDRTHQEFIRQVAALISTSDAEFPALFQALINHTRIHFTEEGQLMRASKYRGLPEHESEHHRVLGELQQLNRSLKRGRILLVRAYVREGLPAWFDSHLAMMDSALAMHLKSTSIEQ